MPLRKTIALCSHHTSSRPICTRFPNQRHLSSNLSHFQCCFEYIQQKKKKKLCRIIHSMTTGAFTRARCILYQPVQE
ncbi:unnamed protein product [Linum tenue]|uniref:Uncharacterized protein n=1 Tax=Linum tenue TaxID=586396 RepID=A0AAV0MYC3_9ROSI|nr:unnamed protein product [Linum tenue]